MNSEKCLNNQLKIMENKYTKEQYLKAAELGEVSMIDAKHVVSLLDEVVANEAWVKCNEFFINQKLA